MVTITRKQEKEIKKINEVLSIFGLTIEDLVLVKKIAKLEEKYAYFDELLKKHKEDYQEAIKDEHKLISKELEALETTRKEIKDGLNEAISLTKEVKKNEVTDEAIREYLYGFEVIRDGD